jgi:putative membrane protein
MLWFKAFHIIAVVAWFAGLFYLPRLFVYHADATDLVGIERFKVMERRLYYAIMWPAALLTTLLGLLVVNYSVQYYMTQTWFHWKIGFVSVLWCFHLYCGHLLKEFAADKNQHHSRFYRILNEFPTIILVIVVCLVVIKP